MNRAVADDQGGIGVNGQNLRGENTVMGGRSLPLRNARQSLARSW